MKALELNDLQDLALLIWPLPSPAHLLMLCHPPEVQSHGQFVVPTCCHAVSGLCAFEHIFSLLESVWLPLPPAHLPSCLTDKLPPFLLRAAITLCPLPHTQGRAELSLFPTSLCPSPSYVPVSTLMVCFFHASLPPGL